MRFKVFHFLNDLRASGTTNMFGATPFIQAEFCMDRSEAKKWLIEWMEWVSNDPSNRDK